MNIGTIILIAVAIIANFIATISCLYMCFKCLLTYKEYVISVLFGALTILNILLLGMDYSLLEKMTYGM